MVVPGVVLKVGVVAVQQPVQADALRRVTPLACARVAPLLVRGLTWRCAFNEPESNALERSALVRQLFDQAW